MLLRLPESPDFVPLPMAAADDQSKKTLSKPYRARSETESKCSETERARDEAYWVALFCAPSRRPDHDLQTQTELEIILCHMFV